MHMTAETAINLVEGRLKQGKRADWNAHALKCALCANDLVHWQNLIGVLKRSHLKRASQRDLENAIHVFRGAVRGVAKQMRGRLRQAFAIVAFDSFRQPAFAGSRGSAGQARQVVLTAENFDIHVKIWGEQGQRQLLGQLLPRSGRDFVHQARFHLLHNGERLDSTVINEVGEFRFANVPAGDLGLQIDLPKLTVIGTLIARTPET